MGVETLDFSFAAPKRHFGARNRVVCMVVDISDVVTYTNFGDNRLRRFWVAGGQISPSPIDFHCRPYNTLALPCERVIYSATFHLYYFNGFFSKWRSSVILDLSGAYWATRGDYLVVFIVEQNLVAIAAVLSII